MQINPIPAELSPQEADRFRGKIDTSGGPDVCHLWTGARSSNGYGSFRVGGRTYKAHRIAAGLAGIEVPLGYLVCHHCDVRLCCNGAHLFAGTHRDNTQDMLSKGRGNPHLKGGSYYAVLAPERMSGEARARLLAGDPAWRVAESLSLSLSNVERMARALARQGVV